jgi:hypothetical protein
MRKSVYILAFAIAHTTVFSSDVLSITRQGTFIDIPLTPIAPAALSQPAAVAAATARPSSTWSKICAALSCCMSTTAVIGNVVAQVSEAKGDKKTADAMRIANESLIAGSSVAATVAKGLDAAETNVDVVHVLERGVESGLNGAAAVLANHGVVDGTVSAALRVVGETTDLAAHVATNVMTSTTNGATTAVAAVADVLQGGVSIATSAVHDFGSSDAAGAMDVARAVVNGNVSTLASAATGLLDGDITASDKQNLVHAAASLTTDVVRASGADQSDLTGIIIPVADALLVNAIAKK